MTNKVSILGTEYTIKVKAYEDDPRFEKKQICGYCDGILHRIVVCDTHTFKGEDGEDWALEPDECHEETMKATLRHEIVHAFFNESGLKECSAQYHGPWTEYEEMVDYWAIQGPKIYKAWQEAGAV